MKCAGCNFRNEDAKHLQAEKPLEDKQRSWNQNSSGNLHSDVRSWEIMGKCRWESLADNSSNAATVFNGDLATAKYDKYPPHSTVIKPEAT